MSYIHLNNKNKNKNVSQVFELSVLFVFYLCQAGQLVPHSLVASGGSLRDDTAKSGRSANFQFPIFSRPSLYVYVYVWKCWHANEKAGSLIGVVLSTLGSIILKSGPSSQSQIVFHALSVHSRHFYDSLESLRNCAIQLFCIQVSSITKSD